MIKTKEFGHWNRAEKFFGDFLKRKRLDRYQAFCVRKAANLYSDYVQDRIPNEFQAYRDSLEVKEVTGVKIGKKTVPACAVISEPKAEDVEKMPVDNRVVEFRVLYDYQEKMSPTTRIITKYQPWTLDTIPAVPSPKETRITYRYVAPSEYLQIRERNKNQLPTVIRELKDEGVVIVPNPLKGINAKLDVMRVAMNLEFGLNEFPRISHWRAGIRELRKTGFMKMGRDKHLQRTIADPDYGKWKYLPRMKEMRVKDALKLRRFVEKMGLTRIK
jgi:hypothetical protein